MSISLRQNEKLIKTVRHHGIFLLPVFLTWPLIMMAVLLIRGLTDFDFFGYENWTVLISFMITALGMIYQFYLWYYNALVITDSRIIKNEQRGFFSKTVTELLFNDVLEISYNKEGLNASLYNYGDINIRTASENELIVKNIPKPASVVEAINSVRIKNPTVIASPHV